MTRSGAQNITGTFLGAFDTNTGDVYEITGAHPPLPSLPATYELRAKITGEIPRLKRSAWLARFLGGESAGRGAGTDG